MHQTEDEEFEWLSTRLALARSGDEAALGEVVARYRPRLEARVRMMMGQAARRCADTGDFVHDSFLQVLGQLETFELRSTRAFVGWLVTIATGKIADRLRGEHGRRLTRLATTLGIGDPVSPAPAPAAHAVRAEELERLLEGIDALPPDRRRVIELRDFDGCSFGEIATAMGRSENAVQLLHARALAQLSARLAD